MHPVARLIASTLIALVCLAPAATAQDKTGTVNLVLVDDETGDPVQGASIGIKDKEGSWTTDASGRVSIKEVAAGRVELEIRAIGFMPRKDHLSLQAGQTVERRFGLEFTGDKMPELIVTTRREKLSGRYQDFHRRQAAGSGYFIMWDEIKRKGYTRLGDALRNVRGVRTECRTTHSCVIEMSRSENCPPAAVFVDGREADYFGPNTPIGDVYGIEVYRGAGEIPGEFAGTGGCGAVVIWTKNRPYK
jgi:hypothetical protein